MKKIPLTNGQFAIVDDEDYLWLSSFNWCASKVEGYDKFYAVRKIRKPDGRGTNQQMHRVITEAKTGQIVDHRNNDGLDNQKSNLRLTDHSGNARNRSKTSWKILPKGVYVNRSGKTWRARIYVNGRNQHLGCFFSPEEAHKAYKDAAFEYFGEFARIS